MRLDPGGESHDVRAASSGGVCALWLTPAYVAHAMWKDTKIMSALDSADSVDANAFQSERCLLVTSCESARVFKGS